ncbi:MAG: hypothetical protein NZT92_22205, partial [Abditibacteriales bacterium]|nr:hypothetical protein [Abditibacteriales bacterium]
MRVSPFCSDGQCASGWLVANVCALVALGLVVSAAAQKITLEVRSDRGIVPLGAVVKQVQASGRELYVDRRLANIPLVIPTGAHDGEALLRAITLATRLEVRPVGRVSHIGPLRGEQLNPEEVGELDRILAHTFHDLLTAEAERLQQEGIPFEVSDFVSRKRLVFNQLTARQRAFIQQMFLRQKAWEDYLSSRASGRLGTGFSFKQHYEPQPN